MRTVYATLKYDIKTKFGTLDKFVDRLRPHGVHRQQFSEILNGWRVPTKEQARVIAHAVGKKPSEVFGGEYDRIKVL